jgi:riboflavin kinase/FMN adenylyltransferase
VVALGVFDGVHIGHRKVIAGAVRRARRVGGTSIAVTFWPHPQREETLHSLTHRLRILEQLGVDVCVVLRFTPSLAKMPPETFVAKIIAGRLRAKEVFVGSNFRFGKNAAGDITLLRRLGRTNGFRVRVFTPVTYRGRRVSSTAIRALINRGIRLPRKLLGSE